MTEIIYEPHPVSPERKAELRAKGYQIVDAAYAPEGYESPEPNAAKPLTFKQLKAALRQLQVEFAKDATQQQLQHLLDEASKPKQPEGDPPQE